MSSDDASTEAMNNPKNGETTTQSVHDGVLVANGDNNNKEEEECVILDSDADDDDANGNKDDITGIPRNKKRSKKKTQQLVWDDDDDEEEEEKEEEDCPVVNMNDNANSNNNDNVALHHDVSFSSASATLASSPPVTIRIAKYFDGELFLGTVVHTENDDDDDDDEQDKLWHILYEDGDEEDFDLEELEEGVALFRQYQQETDAGHENDHEEVLLLDTDDDDDFHEDDGQKEKPKRARVKNESRIKRRPLKNRHRATKSLQRKDKTASSSGDENSIERPTERPVRRRKRKMMSESIRARKAQAQERQRERERKQWRTSHVASTESTIVINEARPDAEQEVTIAPALGSQLKPHQIDGVRFLWQSLIHSIAASNEEAGRGAILAHSMGLGKSLQVVTFLHTILLYEPLPFCNAIVLGPKNTLYNWRDEFHKWNADEDMEVHLVDPSIHKSIAERLKIVKRWYDRSSKQRPAILLMSYDQFKVLVGGRPKAKMRGELRKRLLDPGPDIAVLDEGHVIANPKTATNLAVMEFKSKRRLILTGTPLSNNLREYHSMVNFVHQDLLSSPQEFRSRFVLPIEAGQFLDASDQEVRLMKRRVHVLNRKLKPLIHRRGYDILQESLPEKFEYIISVRLTDVQKKLYQMFLDRRKTEAEDGSFFHAWHSLQRIWNHPRGLEYAEEQRKENERRAILKREMSDFIDGGSETSFHDGGDSSAEEMLWHESDSEVDDAKPAAKKARVLPTSATHVANIDDGTSSVKEASCHGDKSQVERGGETSKPPGKVYDATEEECGDILVDTPENSSTSRQDHDWWKQTLGKASPRDLATESGKFQVLKDIVRNLRPGDKLGIFSQSLAVLNLIEAWLINEQEFHDDGGGDENFEFCKGVDLLRIDGSTSSERRQHFCNKINDMEDPARVILVSVKAGALGINLVGVNRVVLFDTSFNPTHDVQAIFRAYRYGQTRPVSIYRLIAAGTMEERIYRKQVEKRALFSRVVDEHQIERHFSRINVNEMVRLLDDEGLEAEEASKSKIQYKSHTDAPPSDVLFAQLLVNDRGQRMPRYHEHDSLLENKEDEELSEQEKKDAWAEFERAIADEKVTTDQLRRSQQPNTHPTERPMPSSSLDILRMCLGANVEVVKSFRFETPGDLGINFRPMLTPGRNDIAEQFVMIVSTTPGMPGEVGGLRSGDILLYPGTNNTISYGYFTNILVSVRPLVVDVARAQPSQG